MKSVFIPFTQHKRLSFYNGSCTHARDRCCYGTCTFLYGQRIGGNIFHRTRHHKCRSLYRKQRMIEIAVIFHYVRIAVSVYISRTAQQVTGVNRNLHPDRMQIIFHHLIKFPVNKNSKLHIICISCRAVHSFP